MANMLPKEYQKIEYIESNGTQWINTEIYPTNNTIKLEVKIAYNDTKTGQLMGSGTSGTERFNFGIEGSRFRFGFGDKWFDAHSDVLKANTEPHIWILDANTKTGSIDGIKQTATTNVYSPSGSRAIILFARGMSSVAESSNKTRGKLYYTKIWNNGDLVRDMVPCYRKSDNEIGMYDIANDTFYTNKGSDTFIAGPDVVEPDIEEPEIPIISVISTGSVYEGIDWTKSMSQTFEFYKVDPITWKDTTMLTQIKKCSISRDEETQTLGSATIDATETLDECYVRIYLVVSQNGFSEKVALGTYLVQTPSTSYDGKSNNITMDAYTPLIELKEGMPPLGYSLLKDTNIMDVAYDICREHMRAPVVKANSKKTLYSDFISNTNDTWTTFVSDLVANANYKIDLDEVGRVLFAPIQDIASLQHRWIYNDDNSSILYPEVTNKRDLYGIPNVVEVVYSTDTGYVFSRIVNDDENSPISTVNRGREIIYRDTNPNLSGEPTQEMLDDYATQLLRNLSCLEHTITYTHGYCPVRVGDCVLLNYKEAGLNNIRAKVISQNIKCVPGTPVQETAVYTTKLWR